MTFDGFMNFTLGILDGSSVTTNNTQLMTCKTTINSQWFNGFQVLINHAKSSNYFGVTYQLFSMLKSIDPIARSCFGGVQSSMLQYYDWSGNSTSSTTLLTNFGLNLGKVLNSVKDVTLYFADTVYESNCKSTKDAGNSIGVIIKSFFIEPALRNSTDTSDSTDFWGEGR